MSAVMRAAYYTAPVMPPGTAPAMVDDAAVPAVAPGCLLVRNLAASINPVDKYIAAGFLADKHPIFKPTGRAFGSDFAGIVTAVGAGATVTELDGTTREAVVGDAVFGDGIQGTGSFAEFVMVVASQAVVKPRGLSFAAAAAIPLAGLTAYQCFTQHSSTPVGPGMKVLVLGGTGGVGSFAIQIAKALGATVAATGSNTAKLTELGADVAINYREADWGEQLKGQDYDLVFATVDDPKPTPAAERALGVLGPKGSFIYLLEQIAAKEGTDLGGRKFAFMMTDSTKAAHTAQLAAWVLEGKVKPLYTEFAFDEAGWQALMAASNSGRAQGKLVMNIQ